MTQPVHEAPVSFYQSAEKIYARGVRGRYARLRVLAVIALLGLFYALPWLSWQGQPLVLFDLPARRFHVFGLTLVPQDLFLLTALLLIAALTLFLFTTLAGRLWCGYACPQTVWTEAFMWMERWVEGDRLQRQKLDRMPWNATKLRKKLSKHALWIAFAAWTGITFVGFFVPIKVLFADLAAFELGGWALFWSIFYAVATWGNAGFLREQVCRYMCPYARFQSVMFDKDTLVIAYDEARGEPRKSKAKDDVAGDCIDCTMCVQVCPTGIDIRNGLQYECIACAACVDACNSVMDKVGKPRGLVRYTSTRRDTEGRFHILRPRMIGYAVVWSAALVMFATVLLTRSPLELDVLRDRHTLGRTLADGSIENIYTLKITNKSGQPREVDIRAATDSGQALVLSSERATIAAGQTRSLVLSARLPKRVGDQPTLGIRFDITSLDDKPIERSEDARFVVGMP